MNKKINKLIDILINSGHKKEAGQINNLLKKANTNNRFIKSSADLKSVLSKSFYKNENGIFLRESSIPSAIISIPEALEIFVREKGRDDVTIKSNGSARAIEEALSGSDSKMPGSLHGLAFAHDLKISSEKAGTYTGLGSNVKILQNDPELAKLMHKFALAYNLEWGGLWERGTSVNIGNNVYWSEELHHFELKESQLVPNLAQGVKEYMDAINMPYEYVTTAGGRTDLYKRIIKDFYSSKNS